ncbi:MAG: 5-formyltetrahydrofolate cyclo-ligase [Pontiellaceae bacterium]|nr:5-formyltetrahydrofolate cyclo-ligase [Pontiellaceae bacterium]MBN2786023.1 5-formyltetrahydrofolate cyclo-ligase [Pontiellaceae bacterium]
MSETKQQMRREIAALRRKLQPEWVVTASQQITERLRSEETFQSARSVALYKAIAGEVQLEELFAECWQLGKRTVIPVFNAAVNCYELAEVDANTPFVTGNYGIQEPVDAPRVPVEQLDLMVVPGIAFDAAGNRLGRGGGYYDRLLTGFQGTAIAVAFDFQFLDTVPHENYDIPMDFVVTPTNVLKVSNEH